METIIPFLMVFGVGIVVLYVIVGAFMCYVLGKDLDEIILRIIKSWKT